MIINKRYAKFVILFMTGLLFLCNCQNSTQEKPTENPPDNCFVIPPTTTAQDLKPDKNLELTYQNDEQPVVGQIIELDVKNISKEYIRIPDGYGIIIYQETGLDSSYNYIFDQLNNDQQKSFILEPAGLENDHKTVKLLPNIYSIDDGQFLIIAIIGQRYIDGKTCKDSYGALIRLTVQSANGTQEQQ